MVFTSPSVHPGRVEYAAIHCTSQIFEHTHHFHSTYYIIYICQYQLQPLANQDWTYSTTASIYHRHIIPDVCIVSFSIHLPKFSLHFCNVPSFVCMCMCKNTWNFKPSITIAYQYLHTHISVQVSGLLWSFGTWLWQSVCVVGPSTLTSHQCIHISPKQSWIKNMVVTFHQSPTTYSISSLIWCSSSQATRWYWISTHAHASNNLCNTPPLTSASLLMILCCFSVGSFSLAVLVRQPHSHPTFQLYC